MTKYDSKVTNLPPLVFSRKLRRIGRSTVNYVTSKGKQNIIIFGALVFLILIFGIINSAFFSQLGILGMVQKLIPYAVMGLGVTFVIATGGIDLSIGVVSMASAFFAGWLYQYKSMPLWLTIPIMMIVGLAFGLLNGSLVAKLKLPPFIATLGTMLLAKGLIALIPTIFTPEVPYAISKVNFPTSGWYKELFSNTGYLPVGVFWLIALTIIAMYIMYKSKVGRYILSIGSNEEATRLSGINADKYKIIAYAISGLAAGIAAIFWTSAFPLINVAEGGGMELDAIAGVYIGGTSASGGIASIVGTIIGASLLVVINKGLNQMLSGMDVSLNSTHVTYVITGIIVVAAVLMDIVKTKKASRVKIVKNSAKLMRQYKDYKEEQNVQLDYLISDKSITQDEKEKLLAEWHAEMDSYKKDYGEKMIEMCEANKVTKTQIAEIKMENKKILCEAKTKKPIGKEQKTEYISEIKKIKKENEFKIEELRKQLN